MSRCRAFRPDEWRGTLGENYNDEKLAAALAGAWNECGWLGRDLDDDDRTPVMASVHEAWWSLVEELTAEIARRINQEYEAPYVKFITPFMERSGYCVCRGWCIKSDE